MKLVCPGCGATGSLESWANDADCREAIAAIVRLPQPLPPITLNYLSLFRPGSRALSWKKVKRVVSDLAALVTTGHIQIQGKVSRPCHPSVWMEAMEDMLTRRDQIKRPLKNHNYLCQVAYGIADTKDGRNEAAIRESEASGNLRTEGPQIKRSALDRMVHGDDNADQS